MRIEKAKVSSGSLMLPKTRPVITPSTGFGDTVAKVLKPFIKLSDKLLKTNLKNCGSCNKRKEVLNSMFPYEKG